MELLRTYWKNYNLPKPLFQWQIDALTKRSVTIENRNFIFSAPTSAGKSLVADLLFLRPLMLRKKHQVEPVDVESRPVSLFIVPFLSLILEKETKISALLKELNLNYISIYSHKRAILPADADE